MNLPDSAKNRRDFFRLATFATALAFGAVISSLVSLRKVDSGFTFVFTLATVAVFPLGAGLGWLFWNSVRRVVKSSGAAKKRAVARLAVVSAVVLAGAIAAFLYPLRFATKENLRDVFGGLVLAAGALSLVGWAMSRVIRFLNRDLEEHPHEGPN